MPLLTPKVLIFVMVVTNKSSPKEEGKGGKRERQREGERMEGLRERWR